MEWVVDRELWDEDDAAAAKVASAAIHAAVFEPVVGVEHGGEYVRMTVLDVFVVGAAPFVVVVVDEVGLVALKEVLVGVQM